MGSRSIDVSTGRGRGRGLEFRAFAWQGCCGEICLLNWRASCAGGEGREFGFSGRRNYRKSGWGLIGCVVIGNVGVGTGLVLIVELLDLDELAIDAAKGVGGAQVLVETGLGIDAMKLQSQKYLAKVSSDDLEASGGEVEVAVAEDREGGFFVE